MKANDNLWVNSQAREFAHNGSFWGGKFRRLIDEKYR